MEIYKESGKFVFADVVVILVIGLIASLLVGTAFHYLVKFTNFSLIFIYPLIQVGIASFIVLSQYTKKQIRNFKIALFFGAVFGIVLYLTPHAFNYYEIEGVLVDYYSGETGYSKNEVRQSLEYNVFDYIQLRSATGTSVGRVLSKSQNWGAIGFYLFEILDLIILVGAYAWVLYSFARTPFSEKHQRFYSEKILLKDLPKDELAKYGSTSSISFTSFKEILVKDYSIVDDKGNKIPLETIEVIKTPEAEEYAVKLGKQQYLLDSSEVQEIKKLLS